MFSIQMMIYMYNDKIIVKGWDGGKSETSL